MIATIRGKVLEVDGDIAVVETGGVGLGVHVPARVASSLSRSGDEPVFLYTHLHVRDDALQLFGFATRRERAFFLSLTSVSGVGPKVALAILSTYPVEELEAAVVRSDAKKLESIPGIGRKLAQRLVIELKDTVALDLQALAPLTPGGGDRFVQAREALQSLGLSLREAEAALRGAPDDATLEDLVKFALRKRDDV